MAKMGSLAQFTDLQTLEDTGMPLTSDPLRPKDIMNSSQQHNIVQPQIMLNIPSDTVLMPVEGIMSPIDIGTRNQFQAAYNEKYQLRSPSKATQEEIDLTKRYYGINEEIKQSKIIK